MKQGGSMNDRPCALTWEALWHGTSQKKLGIAPATDPDLTGLGKWLTDPRLQICPRQKSRAERNGNSAKAFYGAVTPGVPVAAIPPVLSFRAFSANCLYKARIFSRSLVLSSSRSNSAL